MRIEYRETDGGAEIVRCYGTDPYAELPEEIRGMPVVRVAAYTFSARKDSEDEDVLVYEAEEDRIFRQQERLLAGEAVEGVVFPDSVREIGRYSFYGCHSLSELSLSDSLREIGSGAFTGCRALRRLSVRLLRGERSCVSEILGDLWQRIDVVFQSGTEEARLVFPEHYEEAVENTPARILFTQHHGSGNNYRQCFYNKEMDYRKYDDLFSVARAHDDVGVLSDLVFSRLRYPVGLTEAAREIYETYLKEHAAEIGSYLAKKDDLNGIREMSRRKLWTETGISAAIECAARNGGREALSLLMNEKQTNFRAKRDKYEL